MRIGPYWHSNLNYNVNVNGSRLMVSFYTIINEDGFHFLASTYWQTQIKINNKCNKERRLPGYTITVL